MATTDDGDWRAKSFEAGRIFTPTSPINAQELFAGRDEQLRQIVDVINQPGQHAILYGERGVGKTSLANVFAAHLQGFRILAPRINCDVGDTFDSVWRKVVEQANLTRQKPGMGFVPTADAQVIRAEEFLGLSATPDSVRRFLSALSGNFLPVVVIDEFDRLPEEPRRAFADTIKGLSDHAVPATILLVGVADSVDQLLAEHESVQRALAQVRMPRMSGTELGDIVTIGLQKLGMDATPIAKTTIVRLSQGLPHYAHLLSLHATRAALDQKVLRVDTDHVARALDRALVSTQQSTLKDYETAVRSARKDNLFSKVLLSCALARTNDLGEFAAQDVRDRLNMLTGASYEIPNFAQHLKEFCDEKRGPILVKSGIPRLYRYKFIDPLMQPYVLMQGIKSGMVQLDRLE
jgi:Cdc6-like AAA superfamily ATPase